MSDTAQSNHYLIRVADGKNFEKSRSKKIWGCLSTAYWARKFLSNAKPGDTLWFIRNKSGGRVVGVATFTHHCPRVLGPLLDLSLTDEELGWTGNGNWDTEIHYTNLIDVWNCEILTNMKGQIGGQLYTSVNCTVDLPEEYKRILKYSNAFVV